MDEGSNGSLVETSMTPMVDGHPQVLGALLLRNLCRGVIALIATLQLHQSVVRKSWWWWRWKSVGIFSPQPPTFPRIGPMIGG